MFGNLGTMAKGLVGRAARAVAAAADGDQAPPRLARRYEQYTLNLWNSIHALVDEGSVYVATTATPGTGITSSSTTGNTYSATQGIFGFNNKDVSPSLGGAGQDVIPLWLKMVITAAGANGTDEHFASVVDLGARVSGGTQLTGKNVNPNFPALDDSTEIFTGVPTIAAATNQLRIMGRAEGRKAAAPAYIVGDVVTFVFGSVEQVQVQAITPTSAIGLVLPLPAVVIGPGWSWCLLEWMAARLTTAQSAEFEFGYVKR